ncbi:MAG: YdbH domain-containing protein, partial [Gammaproteobacteria bacterium]|nr:YdbH domain-containing protein [Gammaproteobacteria bacterium]
SGRSEFAFSLDGRPLAASVTTNEGSSAVGGMWPGLQVDGVMDSDGVDRLAVRFEDGAVSLSGYGFSARGIDGAADWRDGSLVASALHVATLESLASPAWIAPVAIDAEAADDGGDLAFEASASDPLGTFVLDASGRHGPERTSAAIRLYPIRFVPGATEISDLSPRLAEWVTEAAGLVEFEGRVERTEEGLTGAGTLQLQGLSATVSGVPIEDVRSEIRLASLLPPATEPAQTLTIARVDLGMPLEDGVAVFDLADNGRLSVERLDFAFAGGRLFAEPFTVDSVARGDIGFVLRAEDVQLAEFLASSRIEGIAGSGTLSGRMPVRLSDGGIRLDDGVLAAETDGVLRYTPDDLPDFLRGDDVRSKMLREVLTNFHYDDLSLAVSGESGEGGAQRLTLNARGANPDFLEGHPIELAFNFTGPLLGAVRSAVDLSGAAELEERFEQQEADNEENSR